MMERRFCSQANPDEPLAGTADVVGAWLLLEYRPVWKARAHEDNSLAPPIADWLTRSIAALRQAGIKARPQFIRQPERESDQVRLLLGLPAGLFQFSGPGYDALTRIDLVAAMRDPQAAGARRLEQPQYFVCTNGQRDVCCARFGLPVYAALRERVGQRVWQVTHLGGHRFAPNVLVLPQGALYGRVTPAVAGEFVDRIETGALAFAQLRGGTFQPKPVQAAEAFSGRSDLRLLHVVGDDARARVRFAAGDDVVEIVVERAATGLPVLASCSDAEPEIVFPYRRC